MKTILQNWNVMRGFRLLLGIVALVQAVMQHDMTVGLLGGFLLVTALANVGCCGSTGCAVKVQKNTDKKIAYEELDAKQ